MKKIFTILVPVWMAFSCWLLIESVAQTNPTSEYRQPGDVLVRMANSTNVESGTALTVIRSDAPPIQQRVETWLTTAKDWVSGALVIIAALLAWLANANRNKAAESGTIATVLIKEIQKVATKGFKNDIADAAREAGVSDSLHAAVKENTLSVLAEPHNYTAELVAHWPPKPPVVDPPKPSEIKPI